MEYPHLQAEVLSQMATGVRVPEGALPLTRMLLEPTSDDTDQDVAAWDEKLPIRELDTQFETRESQATNTTPPTAKQRTASMALSFKKRTIKPETLRFLRAIGGGGKASNPQKLALMIGDMVRRYWYEKWEYLFAGALQGVQNFTVGGTSVSIDYGIPASHKMASATDWSNPAADIDADIETMKREVAEDSGFALRRMICGRDIAGYLRRNTDLKSWFQGRESAPADLRKLYGTEVIPDLFGIDWVFVNAGYLSSGTWTPYIPDDYVIGIPEISQEWLLSLHGPVMYPTRTYGGLESFETTNGIAAWSEVTSEPPSATYFQRWTGLPVLAFPSAIAYINTVA